MGKTVKITKTVFNSEEYSDVIDRQFKIFKQPEPIVDTDTIEELFRLYEKFYAQIAIEGPNQSHQYLVERSSELYAVDSQLDAIQPLLDEVASLRAQLLDSNRQILELELQLAGGDELDFSSAEQLAALRAQLAAANAQNAALEAQQSVNDAMSASNDAAAEANQQAADAEAKAKRDRKVQEIGTYVSVDDQKRMNSIINWSSRARRRKKRRRLDNKRDNKKVKALIQDIDQLFPAADYDGSIKLEGLNSTPIKQRVNFSLDTQDKLQYTLIKM